jgi:hypothetical protein
MTILSQLHADVQQTVKNGPVAVLLWLDPGREWERLVNQLPPVVAPLKYDGSQLRLRAEIERGATGKPRIVYVPLSRGDLTVLKEYEFSLPVWDEGLLPALRRWGVEIDRQDERALLPLLPALAARWSEKPLEFWRHRRPGQAAPPGWPVQQDRGGAVPGLGGRAAPPGEGAAQADGRH